jgi:predicted dehydrogenase
MRISVSFWKHLKKNTAEISSSQPSPPDSSPASRRGVPDHTLGYDSEFATQTPPKEEQIMERMKWAILGTGKIGKRFAESLNNIPDQAELLAVGSRSQEAADAFGESYDIPRRYAGYEQVMSDPDVEIVYIGTPGVYHLQDTRIGLEAGKHVLCEKALAINAEEAEEMIALAREKGLFLMEAMWTRFFPIHVRIRELLDEEAIGRVNGMTINFIAQVPFDAESRFFRVDLGAGVLLDLASYGVSLASSLFGEPEAVTGLASFGETGCDNQAALALRYTGGQLVSLISSQLSYDVKDAVIFGTDGKIEINAPWYKPTKMTVHVRGKDPEEVVFPLNGFNGYEYEAMEVMNCIQAGKLESEVMPLDDSLSIMRTLDEVRAQWDYTYPSESQE